MPNSVGPQPVVTVSRRGAERLRAGHVWVYRSDVVEAKDVLPGALITVQEVGGFRPKQLSDKSVRPTGKPFTSTGARLRASYSFGDYGCG
jgi:hypothetical protein